MRSIELQCAVAHWRISRFPDAQLRICGLRQKAHPGMTVISDFFHSTCRSAPGPFVVPDSETVPRARGPRLASMREFFDALHVYRYLAPAQSWPDASADGGHAQAGRPGDQ